MVVEMLRDHWLWGGLTLAVLAWYSTVTLYVAYRGALDIRSMLGELSARRAREDESDTAP
jgi:hypothetical protein